jgi:hypothetical protein
MVSIVDPALILHSFSECSDLKDTDCYISWRTKRECAQHKIPFRSDAITQIKVTVRAPSDVCITHEGCRFSEMVRLESGISNLQLSCLHDHVALPLVCFKPVSELYVHIQGEKAAASHVVFTYAVLDVALRRPLELAGYWRGLQLLRYLSRGSNQQSCDARFADWRRLCAIAALCDTSESEKRVLDDMRATLATNFPDEWTWP